ncbi:hypothetical protein [Anaerosalibacter sp. Marseille-P3206]|uniref:hypothetical protein n=1 Tax=Anaerosalibacter sp. Marseille-P3206 TaxID=1871005 RepID=UPI000986EFB0|nr:hypothetical protein [Anaerosalibacter sp. Marseille-P3206]
MNVIKLSFYERTSDEELIEMIYMQIDVLKQLIDYEDGEEYWKEAMLLNNMIIEIKKRNLSIRKDRLIKNILKA